MLKTSQRLILLFCISLLTSFVGVAQEETNKVIDSVATDSVVYKKKYGLRVGVDLATLARTAFEDGYTGVQIMGDFRIYKSYFLALELGNEERTWDEENLNATTSGSYAKIGADYNAYNNWLGMDNAIFVGLRYGFATFKNELNSYSIYNTNQVFPSETVVPSEEFTNLSASWAELILGIKTEVLNNLFLGINVQLKRMVSEKTPENFDNLIVPGFNRTYDFSEYGVGYGYTLTYLIPIFKR
ncbi:DUF6048 family protein [Altibacter sp. HG106]|uniref:DUF6048 family protein n=1 Tax=Altibacter sp. HG106 TaxID=3023937 RepID=UPI002350C7C8|nr:DUF6048 family protein [Altibacter sp. HG106]MDC7996170.1 DUF6048 family protein [Altibacter sp. HG106]